MGRMSKLVYTVDGYHPSVIYPRVKRSYVILVCLEYHYLGVDILFFLMSSRYVAKLSGSVIYG
jgi:hypothetical protein